jgi:hypothetical protein
MMLRARPFVRRLAAIAMAVVAALAGCDSSTDTGAAPGGDGGPDATLDAPPGSDGAGGSGDGATDGASPGDADLTKDGAPDATVDGSGAADASIDAIGADVVVDGAGFLDAAGDDGGACNTLANPAPLVQQVDIATARPAATGGSLVDGMYLKSADAIYTGPGGATGLTGYTVHEALLITNSSTGTALLTSTFIDNAGTTTTERLTVSPTTSSGAMTLTFVCPPYGPSPTFFNMRTGDAGEIVLDIFISTDRIETFTRQ